MDRFLTLISERIQNTFDLWVEFWWLWLGLAAIIAAATLIFNLRDKRRR